MGHIDRTVLEKAELDAFLAQAISPKLMDLDAIQEISVLLKILFDLPLDTIILFS